jgi:hypothetical protein
MFFHGENIEEENTDLAREVVRNGRENISDILYIRVV